LLLRSIRQNQIHFSPQHWLLCHLGLY
jgi:hypothetical protein